MNSGTITGGVVKDAYSAYTAEPPQIRRVVFAIATRDSLGGSTVWTCEAEGDDHRLDWVLGQCTAGRGIRLEYELASRPFYKKGVHVGESRFLRVLNVEFPERVAREPEPVEAGP